MIKRLSKFLLVLVLITGWIFSGWPGIQTAEAVSAETFTTSTTWTAPTGVTSVTAEVWGGGGGGGGMNASTDGGGGGGGAYSQQVVTVGIIIRLPSDMALAVQVAPRPHGDSWFSSTVSSAKGGSQRLFSRHRPAGRRGGFWRELQNCGVRW